MELARDRRHVGATVGVLAVKGPETETRGGRHGDQVRGHSRGDRREGPGAGDHHAGAERQRVAALPRLLYRQHPQPEHPRGSCGRGARVFWLVKDRAPTVKQHLAAITAKGADVLSLSFVAATTMMMRLLSNKVRLKTASSKPNAPTPRCGSSWRRTCSTALVTSHPAISRSRTLCPDRREWGSQRGSRHGTCSK